MTGPAEDAVAEARTALAPSIVGMRGRQKARQRLRTARGHLDAVLRMLETDRYCIDVLHQLSAVEGAITRSPRHPRRPPARLRRRCGPRR